MLSISSDRDPAFPNRVLAVEMSIGMMIYVAFAAATGARSRLSLSLRFELSVIHIYACVSNDLCICR